MSDAPDDPSLGIGIDVGGTTTRVVAFADDGIAVYSTASATPDSSMALVDHLTDAVAAAIEATGVPRTVGVGIPGGVHDGMVTMAVNLGVVDPLPLERILTDRLAVPVVVENDVNAAALGAAAHLDTGRSLTLLSIGTGFAAGTIVDGRLVRGGTGLAGEIGHIPFPDRHDPCPCGQLGCIETIVSGQSLVARMDAAGIGGTAVDLWNAADAGHAVATGLRDEFVDALAWSTQLAVMLLDVDEVVIGGGVGTALGRRLVDPVRARLADRELTSPLLRSMAPSERILSSPDGVELGAFGAHLAALARWCS